MPRPGTHSRQQVFRGNQSPGNLAPCPCIKPLAPPTLTFPQLPAPASWHPPCGSDQSPSAPRTDTPHTALIPHPPPPPESNAHRHAHPLRHTVSLCKQTSFDRQTVTHPLFVSHRPRANHDLFNCNQPLRPLLLRLFVQVKLSTSLRSFFDSVSTLDIHRLQLRRPGPPSPVVGANEH